MTQKEKERMSRKEEVLKRFYENKGFMDTVVKDNIEKYRKGDLKISLCDSNNTPIKNAEITITQTKHEFGFGANVFMLDGFKTEKENSKYKTEFKNLFNIATLPFFWPATEPERNKLRFTKDSEFMYRRPPIDLCLEYCKEYDIEPKCHCLNYDGISPKWLEGVSVMEHKQLLEKRFAEISERYADKIPSFEVTNEVFHALNQKHNAFYNENDFVSWSYETAHKYFPNNKLIMNDDMFVWYRRYRGTPYYLLLKSLLLKDNYHIDVIGMQFHFFFNKEEEIEKADFYYNPIFLYDLLNMYGEFNKDIQITEMTIPAYSDLPEDEETQAEIIKNIYTLFFSHPNMSSIIYWNLVDGHTGFSNPGDMTAGENRFYGGLLNVDMSRKKAYTELDRLINSTWHTTDTKITDNNGQADFRGFYGDYDVEIKYKNKYVIKKIKLSKNSNNTYKIVI